MSLKPGRGVVGRESELQAIEEFLASDDPPQALLLVGEPGIGKTTLWEAGIEAREEGPRVLTARPSSAETQLAFMAVSDLLDEVDGKELSELPSPQLHALEVALLRTEPTGPQPESRAVAVAFLGALRALSAEKPLLVAVDDVQWLDRASAEALAFAARRLRDHPIRFLVSLRTGESWSLETALATRGLQRVELGPLSLGGIRRMLFDRLGMALPRRTLRRIFEAAGGNPLFALELARAEEGGAGIGQEIALPDALEDLIAARVERLPAPVRRLLLAADLSGDLRMSQLLAISEPGALDDALEAGVLRFERDRVSASHPLLGAAVRALSVASDRRDLHRELAEAVDGEEQRARHFALAADAPDVTLAATVASAATRAAARGAAEAAVELADHALRLTPPDSPDRHERLLALAEFMLEAGELQGVKDLLAGELDQLPHGSIRVRALILIADSGAVSTTAEAAAYLEQALAESDGDRGLSAQVLARKTEHTAVGRVERIPESEAWALEAVDAAKDAEPEVQRLALTALGWTRILRGQPIGDLSERFQATSEGAVHLYRSFDRLAGIRLTWRGEVRPAREALTRALADADERGDTWSYAVLRLNLSELELRAGEWNAASRLLGEEALEDNLLLGAPSARLRSLAAIGRGSPAEAEQWAAETIAATEATGMHWDLLEGLRARGITALYEHDPSRAAEGLRLVWEHTCREGIDDPGTFPVAPELVEALVELGEPEETQAVIERLEELARAQGHPWALASVKRCTGLMRVDGDAESAAASLLGAAADYERLGLRFDRTRSLLSLGRAERRLRKWGAARRHLEEAATGFEELGSPGWAEQARSELGRVGARKPRAAGELTPSEQRVVELAAAGKSNKEIAQELVVGVHTVEVHLSHAYAKLGIRSRGQLAGRLSRGSKPPKV